MKKIKSLTYILTIVLLVACGKQDNSAAFSSPASNANDTTSAILESSILEQSSIPSSLSSASEYISSLDSSSSSASSSTTNPIDDKMYYNGYYDTLVSWTNGEDLKNQLHTIIRNGYQPLSYTKSSKQNYDTNIAADHSKYDFEYLDVIYSGTDTFKTDTNKGWQREHAWCASLMCGSTTSNAVNYKGRATDFHNLFAANASGNQSRGNKNYGYASSDANGYTVQFSSQHGADGYTYDDNIFEPGSIDKGRLARAIFYMATMYKDDEQDTANNILMKGLRIVEEDVKYDKGTFLGEAFAIGHLSNLLEWNNIVPVDYLEMQHNISVYTNTNNPDGIAQGNRNPYVDYPGLVDYVYGSKKDQPGSLKDVVASASYLECEEEGFSHYAIKEAKREYGYGDTISANDYKIVAVNKNYTYNEVTNNFAHSLSGHTFAESDGDFIGARITTETNALEYRINLNPMGLCNSGILALDSTGLTKTSADVDQNVSYGSIPCIVNFSSSTDISKATRFITNISAGGMTIGSNTYPCTKYTITTANDYTIDSAFIKAQAGNATSSYTLTIKVDNTVVFTKTVNDSSTWKVFGGVLSEPLTGKISFVFTGSSSLKINSIAFNAISV